MRQTPTLRTHRDTHKKGKCCVTERLNQGRRLADLRHVKLRVPSYTIHLTSLIIGLPKISTSLPLIHNLYRYSPDIKLTHWQFSIQIKKLESLRHTSLGSTVHMQIDAHSGHTHTHTFVICMHTHIHVHMHWTRLTHKHKHMPELISPHIPRAIQQYAFP